ncbi:hypothetical protein, partial [Nocardioides sp.]|uniref:hypothetical protein n=1 Tax=Nocardioides sp. TaxID=35761 RepID=UPI00351404DB
KVPQEFLKFYKMNKTKEITRGGEFIVKETKCENIFTTEDFSEEQKMMRDAVKEFASRAAGCRGAPAAASRCACATRRPYDRGVRTPTLVPTSPPDHGSVTSTPDRLRGRLHR